MADMRAINTKFPESPFKPSSRTVFLHDCRLYAQAKAAVAARKAASRLQWQSSAKSNWTAYNGTKFEGHEPCPRGTVLNEHTIWVPMEWYPEFEAISPWPNLEQMKYEGDDRANSRSGRSFGRFLALPRLPSNNPTVAWTMWNVVPFQSFDMVWPIPTAYDIYLPEENEMPREEIPGYLNNDLMGAIEEAGRINC